MLMFYIIFVGALALSADAIANDGNATVAKDKRQIQEHTQNFVPSNHQIVGGHQHHYTAASSEQIAAIPPNYYPYVQRLVQNQQQPQQYQESAREIAPQPRHHSTQPIKQNPYVYFNEPQAHYQPAVDNQHQLQPKVISEEEYLELVRRQNGENVNHTAAPKYHHSNRAGQYKAQKEYQQANYVPKEQPQSYLKSYVNPLGDFSLEKELAQLEKSNKAVYHHAENAEKDTEQSLKKERYEFKPSHQFVEYQQDQFLPAEYAPFGGNRPVPQKLISSPYERDESVSEKAATNNQPEYQIRYVTPAESPAKYYQESIKTAPKNSFVPIPKQQHSDASDESLQANLAKKHSQLIYQKQHQHTTPSPSVQHSPANKKPPTKTAGSFSEKIPQFQSNNHRAPSQSSIFVSQSTGIVQKPQDVDAEQQPQEIHQHHQQVQQQQQQAQQQYHHQPQPQQQQQHHQQQQQPQRLPLTNPNRPLTQEEFQALVDAGYKVQAIPIPVPVPVSAEEYAQHQQKLQQNQPQYQQQQTQPQYQQQQTQPQYQQQQYQPQQQHPYQLQQSNTPTRTSLRPQPSNKHYVRYHQPQSSEGILTSYLRPFLEQYNNLMGGKN